MFSEVKIGNHQFLFQWVESVNMIISITNMFLFKVLDIIWPIVTSRVISTHNRWRHPIWLVTHIQEADPERADKTNNTLLWKLKFAQCTETMALYQLGFEWYGLKDILHTNTISPFDNLYQTDTNTDIYSYEFKSNW